MSSSATLTLDEPVASASNIVRAEWEQLSANVQAFRPGVVVLVARKAPRIRQALELELAPNALVISDLAVPFASRWLRGARVAVVDDVVNVGSTISRAAERVLEAGAAEVQMFAISHRRDGARLPGLAIDYVVSPGLDDTAYRLFAARVPETLQGLARPYDLDFPVLRCALKFPYSTPDEFTEALRETYADDVYELSSARGTAAHVRRFGIDQPSDGSSHRKVRIYVDEREDCLFLVPISIAADLAAPRPDPATGWSASVWAELTSQVPETADGHTRTDALARLRLFCDSLDFGLDFISRHRDLLASVPEGDASVPFALADAELVLGPRVRRVTDSAGASSRTSPTGQPLAAHEVATAASRSRFFEAALDQGFVTAVRNAARGRDPQSAFIATFETLSDWVGVADHKKYRFAHPLPTPDEVRADPYIRLRVGPTFPDLVAIVQEVVGSESAEQTRRTVTRLLDRFIDAGGVVPAMACTADGVQRIYRKGEAELRDPVADRTLYAWSRYGEPLSLTRLTKLLTVLSFSQAGESAVTVLPEERGNTLCYGESVLDEATEVGRYLLRTGRLDEASS